MEFQASRNLSVWRMTNKEILPGDFTNPSCMRSARTQSGDEIKMFRISDSKKLSEGIFKISVKGSIEHKPGQFVMLWIPGVGEKPFVPAKAKGEISFIIRQKGNFTKKLCELGKGEMVGLRGPLGKGFTTKGVKKALLVGGGVGAAPLARLAEELKSNKCKVDTITGARCEEQIILSDHFRKCGNLCIATDNGSTGKKSNAVDIMAEFAGKKKYDRVYVCGPEMMMKKALEYCLKKKINAEFSLERFMKCGMGICGQCALDDLLVCKDGPVFDAKTLAKSKEFGKYAYNKAAKRVTIEEFYKG